MTVDNQCKIQLRNQVHSIIKSIETGQYETECEEGCNAWDYLENALDIEYVSSSRGEYLGARILVAYGGPSIWINTRNRQVEGYWWSDNYTAGYHEDQLELDDYLEEYFNDTR
ncbi:hypothetical protein [Ekhidna sp.]|jgi:hypothetical protein|uniref:hypothetical protein n=1 Tax=Ekhidna sp. TaxID=2608089 RepID=UPI0032EB0B2F